MTPIKKHKWLFLAGIIWIIIIAVPATRLYLQAMTQGGPWIPFSVLPIQWEKRFAQQSAPLPLQVDAIRSNGTNGFWPESLATLEQLDALIEQHPDNPWLIALRLQITTVVFQRDRVGGEMSDANIYTHLQQGIPSPESNGAEVNFTPLQMRRTLELCRRGETLEPQNAFFTWMRTVFLIINWDDDQAWQALHEAAQKTYWNDHYYDFVHAYLNASTTALGRPMIPLEQLSATVISPNFPFSAQTRGMARIIKWEGVKRKRAGQHSQAVKIWSDFHHVMFLAAQGDADMVSFYVDYGMMNIAQSGASYPDRDVLKNEDWLQTTPPLPNEEAKIERQRKEQLLAFVRYAREHHAPKIARQIENDAAQVHQLYQKATDFSAQYIDLVSPTVKTYFRQFQYSAQLFGLGIILILILAGTLLVRLFSLCICYVRPNKSTFNEIDALPPDVTIKRIRICRIVTFALCVLLILYLSVTVTPTTIDSPANIYNFWQLLPISIQFSLTNLTDKLLSFAGQAGTDHTPSQLWRSVFLLIPFAISGLYLLQKYFCHQAHHRGSNIIEGWICILSILILASIIPQPFLGQRLEKQVQHMIQGEMTFIHQLQNKPPQRH